MVCFLTRTGRTERFANEKCIDQLFPTKNHSLLSSFSRFRTATINMREPCTFFDFVNFSASKRIRILRTCVLFSLISIRRRSFSSSFSPRFWPLASFANLDDVVIWSLGLWKLVLKARIETIAWSILLLHVSFLFRDKIHVLCESGIRTEIFASLVQFGRLYRDCGN